tara:strand:+ start:1132 stop:1452 length:321 start_codon:yes stop_codon:yes gene_type:complete
MKNLSKYLFYLFTVLISLSACQNVQDGLSGKKKQNSDEFLVQKKNPLVLPPDYDKLPEPKTLKKNSEDEDIEIILGKGLSSINNSSKTKTSNGPLEKSIIEKIKKN